MYARREGNDDREADEDEKREVRFSVKRMIGMKVSLACW